MMSIKSTRGTEAWVERISVQEVPALSDTIRLLEKMAKDEKLSLADLGKTILNDHGLITRILRVANSVTYRRSGNPVTTISKAVVLLGFNALKQICITAKLVDTLLKSHEMSQPVYERLLRLFAQSLHAGMLAKMILADHKDTTREEAYISALLHHLGECTFWSMGGAITDKLDADLRQSSGNEESVVKEALGTNFNKISAGLVEAWDMGILLQLSLKTPDKPIPELQAIAEANHFSAITQDPNTTEEQFQKELEVIAKLMKKDVKEVEELTKQCAEETLKLSYTYGALILSPYLDPKIINRPSTKNKQTQITPIPPIVINKPDDLLQLKILREITTLAHEKADINQIMQKSLQGIFTGVGMDRVVILMLNREKTKLTPRFVASQEEEIMKEIFVIDLHSVRSVFSHAMSFNEAVWVKSHTDPKWSHLMPSAIKALSSAKGFFISPIMIGKQSIGMFYTDRATSHRELSNEEFFNFTHFVQQTNLCLTSVIQTR
jgi:HD-like signal output (HDOD) protein